MNPVSAVPSSARVESARDAAAPAADLMSLFAALFASAAAANTPLPVQPPVVPQAPAVLPEAAANGVSEEVPCVEVEMPLPAPGGWPGAPASSPPAIPAMMAPGRARPAPTPVRPVAADLHSTMAELPEAAPTADPVARDAVRALEAQRTTPEFRAALRALGTEPGAAPAVTPDPANLSPAPTPAPAPVTPAPPVTTPAPAAVGSSEAKPRVRVVAAAPAGETAERPESERTGEPGTRAARAGVRSPARALREAARGDAERDARLPARAPEPESANQAAALPERAPSLPEPALRAAMPAPANPPSEPAAPAAAAVAGPPELPAEPPAPWLRTHATVAFDNGDGQEGRLRVSLRGNVLHATLQMPDAPAAQRIEHDLAELSRMLRVQGFEDARVAVDAPRAAGSADRSQDQPLPRESRHPREGHAQGGERQPRRERGSAREER